MPMESKSKVLQAVEQFAKEARASDGITWKGHFRAEVGRSLRKLLLMLGSHLCMLP